MKFQRGVKLRSFIVEVVGESSPQVVQGISVTKVKRQFQKDYPDRSIKVRYT